MKKLILLLLAYFLLCPFFYQANAQPDSITITGNKWRDFGNAQKWDSALFYAKESQSLSLKKYGEISHTNALGQLMVAMVYHYMGDLPAAHYFYKKSVEDFEGANKTGTEQYRMALLRLGIVCRNTAAFAESEKYLALAAKLAKEYGDQDVFEQATILLAATYGDLGEYSKAIERYHDIQVAIDTLPKNEASAYRQFSLYDNISTVYAQMGDLQRALVYLKKAERFSRNVGREQIIYILNLADAYAMLNYTDSATIKCNEAEDSLKHLNDSSLYANLFEERATISSKKKQYSQAVVNCLKSIGFANNTMATYDDTKTAVTSLGMYYCNNWQYKEADSVLKNQLRQLRQKSLGGSYIFQQTAAALCKNLIFQQKYREAFDSLVALAKTALTAIDRNFAGMTEAEQLQFLASFDVFFDMANTLLCQARLTNATGLKDIYTLQLQRKSLVLANQTGLLNNMRNTGDTAAANLFATWLDAKQMLAKQYALPYQDRFLNIDSLTEIADRLEKKISVKGLATGFASSQTAFTRLQTLAANVAAIEFVRYKYTTKNVDVDSALYGAYVLKGGDSLPIFVPLCSEKALLKLMVGNNGKPMAEAQLTQNLYHPGSKAAAALYTLIWQPLQKYIPGVTAILYSPAGLLNNISFHAVNTPNGYLSGSYTLQRFLNITGAASANTAAPPNRVSLWGNMVYNAQQHIPAFKNNDADNQYKLASLPATGIRPTLQAKSMSKQPLQAFSADEITPIQQLLAAHNIPVNVYGYHNASEENFKANAPLINGVLHISTHGFYTPLDKKNTMDASPASFIAGNANPLFRCGLAFAGVNYYWMKGVPQPGCEDGILTGYEAAQLDLHNVQLVTLSACETGLGDVTANEGNLGMQRAFKLAGAKNLLVSLWQVPAKATQQLLTQFYTHWLQGNSLSKALQMAEADTRKIHPEPFYWAGFVLVE